MGTPSLDALRNVLGSDLTPDVIDIAARDQLALRPRIQDEYVRQRTQARGERYERPVGHVRPIIEDMLPVLGSLDDTGRLLDRLTFPLLYGHSAAAPDLLSAQLDGTDDYDLAAVLHVYAALAPLLDAEVLIFVDPPQQRLIRRNVLAQMDDLAPLVAELRLMIARLPPAERDFAGLVSLDRPEAWALLKWLGFIDTAAQVSVDPFPRSMPDELTLRLLLRHGAGGVSVADDPLLAVMLHQTTPALEQLTASDLLAIREAGEFEAWRAELTSALADLDQRIAAGHVDVGKHEFTERFRERAVALERMTRRSAALTAVRSSARAFALTLASLGAVSPVVAAPTLAEDAVIATGAAALNLMLELRRCVAAWLSGPDCTRSVARHYAVFASERPSGTVIT